MNEAPQTFQTEYRVEHMDCGAEEQMVRMALEGRTGVEHLAFDLPNRRLTVRHTALAILGLTEVIRRVLFVASVPDYGTMMIVAGSAAVANGLSLYLLSRTDREEAHMKASWIFTSNDVVINLGLLVAGLLVYLTGNRLPNLPLFDIAKSLYNPDLWQTRRLFFLSAVPESGTAARRYLRTFPCPSSTAPGSGLSVPTGPVRPAS